MNIQKDFRIWKMSPISWYTPWIFQDGWGSATLGMGVYRRGLGAAFSCSMKLWHLEKQEFLPAQVWWGMFSIYRDCGLKLQFVFHSTRLLLQLATVLTCCCLAREPGDFESSYFWRFASLSGWRVEVVGHWYGGGRGCLRFELLCLVWATMGVCRHRHLDLDMWKWAGYRIHDTDKWQTMASNNYYFTLLPDLLTPWQHTDVEPVTVTLWLALETSSYQIISYDQIMCC